MRKYGQWAGKPDGEKEDVTRCVVEVSRTWIPTQCYRKRGFGEGKLFCPQHAKLALRGEVLVPEEELK